MSLLRKAAYLGPALIFALACAGPASTAQKLPGPYPDEIGVVYLGNGQVLAAIRPKLLTKNAHIVQFLCSPTGTRIAYLGEIAGPAGVDASLAIVSTQSGDTTTYFHSSFTTPANPDSALLNGLEGWSDDSAYCAFDVTAYSPLPVGSANVDHLEVVDLVHDMTFDIPIPLDQIFGSEPGSTPSLGSLNLEGAAWTPGGRQIAFAARVQTTDSAPVSFLCLCDADQRSTRLLSQSADFLRFEGWQDPTHLIYQAGKGDYVYDLSTGKSAAAGASEELARPAILPGRPPDTITDLPTPDHEALALTGMASRSPARTKLRPPTPRSGFRAPAARRNPPTSRSIPSQMLWRLMNSATRSFSRTAASTARGSTMWSTTTRGI